MKTRILTLLALLGMFTLAAVAADVSGTYKAEVQGRGGNMQTLTMTLKADGANLTGNVATPRGETAISDGKVDGNNVSFNQKVSFGGNEMVIKYKGTVEGDSIKFTRTLTTPNGDERTTEFTAKKQ